MTSPSVGGAPMLCAQSSLPCVAGVAPGTFFNTAHLLAQGMLTVPAPPRSHCTRAPPFVRHAAMDGPDQATLEKLWKSGRRGTLCAMEQLIHKAQKRKDAPTRRRNEHLEEEREARPGRRHRRGRNEAEEGGGRGGRRRRGRSLGRLGRDAADAPLPPVDSSTGQEPEGPHARKSSTSNII